MCVAQYFYKHLLVLINLYKGKNNDNNKGPLIIEYFKTVLIYV